MTDFASLVIPKLISRKIWVMEEFWNFHTVHNILTEKSREIFFFLFFSRKNRSIFYLFFSASWLKVRLDVFFYLLPASNWLGKWPTVWKKIFSRLKNISWNQVFSNYFSKYIAFTKFLSKKCESKFLQFPHCVTLLNNWSDPCMILWSKFLKKTSFNSFSQTWNSTLAELRLKDKNWVKIEKINDLQMAKFG